MLGDLVRHMRCLKHSFVVWCWIDCHMNHWVNEVSMNPRKNWNATVDFVAQCNVAGAGRLRGGRDATGSQPSTEAVCAAVWAWVCWRSRVMARDSDRSKWWYSAARLFAEDEGSVPCGHYKQKDYWSLMSEQCRGLRCLETVMPKHLRHDCTPSHFHSRLFA
jgi:hypothetical protein